MSEQKKRRTRVPAKRRYKVRVIAQPIPTTQMPTVPVNLTPTVPIPTSYYLHPNVHGKVHGYVHTSNGIQFGTRKIC